MKPSQRALSVSSQCVSLALELANCTKRETAALTRKCKGEEKTGRQGLLLSRDSCGCAAAGAAWRPIRRGSAAAAAAAAARIRSSISSSSQEQKLDPTNTRLRAAQSLPKGVCTPESCMQLNAFKEAQQPSAANKAFFVTLRV